MSSHFTTIIQRFFAASIMLSLATRNLYATQKSKEEEQLYSLSIEKKKEYKKQLEIMKNQFFKDPITKHSIIEHNMQYLLESRKKQLVKSIQEVEASSKKVKDYTDNLLKLYSKAQIDALLVTNSSENVKKMIIQTLDALQNKLNHFLFPLKKECKDILKFLATHLKTWSGEDNLEPILKTAQEEKKAQLLIKILKTYQETLRHAYSGSDNLAFHKTPDELAKINLASSESYMHQLQAAKKEWKQIQEEISEQTTIYKNLKNNFPKSTIEEEKKEYEKEKKNIEPIIQKLPVPTELVNYISNIAKKYNKDIKIRVDADGIKRKISSIHASILEIKKLLQTNLIYSQALNQFNKKTAINEESVKAKVREPLISLKHQTQFYLQPIQEKFQEVASFLTKQRKALPPSSSFQKPNPNWEKTIWNAESLLIDILLGNYDQLLKKANLYDFTQPPTANNRDSYGYALKYQDGDFNQLKETHKSIITTFSPLKQEAKTYQAPEQIIKEEKVKYRKEQERMKKTINQLTIPKFLETETKDDQIEKKIKEIQTTIQEVAKKKASQQPEYDSFLQETKKGLSSSGKKEWVKKVTAPLQSLTHLQDYYLLPTHNIVIETLTYCHQAFNDLASNSQLLTSMQQETIEKTKNTFLNDILAKYANVLSSVDGYDFSNPPFYGTYGYSTALYVNKIKGNFGLSYDLKKITTEISSEVEELKSKILQKRKTGKKIVLPTDTLSQTSSQHKDQLHSLLIEKKEEYEKQLSIMNNEFFKDPITKHSIIEHNIQHLLDSTKKQLTKSIEEVQASHKKVKDYTDNLLKLYSKTQLTALLLVKSSENAEKMIVQTLSTLQNKLHHFLIPLKKECKSIVTFLAAHVKTWSENDNLNPVLKTAQEEKTAQLLIKILKIYQRTLNHAYSGNHSLAFHKTPDDLAKMNPFSSESYIHQLQQAKKEWKQIQDEIGEQATTYKNLKDNFPKSTIEQEKKEYQNEKKKIEPIIQKLSVPTELINYINNIAKKYNKDKDPKSNVYTNGIKENINSINASILQIKKLLQTDLIYSQALNQLNKNTANNQESIKAKVREPLISLKHQTQFYLQPIQEKFQELVSFLTKQREALPAASSFQKPNHDWEKTIWKAESLLIDQLLEHYAILLKKGISYDFTQLPTADNQDSYEYALKDQYGDFNKLEETRPEIIKTFSQLRQEAKTYQAPEQIIKEEKIKYTKEQERMKKTINQLTIPKFLESEIKDHEIAKKIQEIKTTIQKIAQKRKSQQPEYDSFLQKAKKELSGWEKEKWVKKVTAPSQLLTHLQDYYLLPAHKMVIETLTYCHQTFHNLASNSQLPTSMQDTITKTKNAFLNDILAKYANVLSSVDGYDFSNPPFYGTYGYSTATYVDRIKGNFSLSDDLKKITTKISSEVEELEGKIQQLLTKTTKEIDQNSTQEIQNSVNPPLTQIQQVSTKTTEDIDQNSTQEVQKSVNPPLTNQQPSDLNQQLSNPTLTNNEKPSIDKETLTITIVVLAILGIVGFIVYQVHRNKKKRIHSNV